MLPKWGPLENQIGLIELGVLSRSSSSLTEFAQIPLAISETLLEQVGNDTKCLYRADHKRLVWECLNLS
jgi:hypothetical protein